MTCATSYPAPMQGDEILPALLIVADPDGLAVIRAVRDLSGPLGSVPAIGWGAEAAGMRAAWLAAGYDDVLSFPCTGEELAAIAEPWRWEEPEDALGRLEAMFGRKEIGALVRQLRHSLVGALSLAHDGDLSVSAHKLAGVAGTLGFVRAGQAWRAVSEGESGALDEARRQSRLAITAIDRRGSAVNT